MASWIVKWYGKYGRNESRIEMRYGQYEWKPSWIVKRYGQWKDRQNMEEREF